MKHVLVSATVQATVDEEWLLKVTNRQADRLKRDPFYFHDLMDDDRVETIKVDNVSVYNEEDRTVTLVEVVGA